jgi:hypothetical protein
MPACPGLVDAAPDLAAFLQGVDPDEQRRPAAGVALRRPGTPGNRCAACHRSPPVRMPGEPDGFQG